MKKQVKKQLDHVKMFDFAFDVHSKNKLLKKNPGWDINNGLLFMLKMIK